MIRRRILLGALLAVLFVIGWSAGRVRASGDLYTNLDLFVEVLHAVQTNYVDVVEPTPLIEGGMRGMLKELDPYSQYLNERDYTALKTQLTGEFDGIGALVDTHEGYPIVVSPIEGSPAWEAGLLPGDIVTKIDEHATFGLTVPEVSAKLRGAAGTKVTVTIVREGDTEPRDLLIERAHITTHSVPYAFIAESGVGYLRLSNFSEKAGAEVAAGIDSLRRAGARSLVLDLRGNPGGLVTQAVEVAQQFVPEGSLVVYTKGRAASVGKKFMAGKARAELAWPVVVLVDGGSASASEIVTGALQDLDRALVLGSPSFGKGSVQDIYPLHNRGGALKLTTGLYYTASGRSLQKRRTDLAELEDDGEDAPAADTSTARPEFKTAAGRKVLGGGGITPDLEVRPDSLPPLARQLEDRRIVFRFANRWRNAHPAAAGIDEDQWQAFIAYAAEQGITAPAADFAAQRARLELLLRRESARRISALASARITLGQDPVMRRAIEVLRGSRTAHDVFAFAPASGPVHAPKRAVPVPSPHGRIGR